MGNHMTPAMNKRINCEIGRLVNAGMRKCDALKFVLSEIREEQRQRANRPQNAAKLALYAEATRLQRDAESAGLHLDRRSALRKARRAMHSPNP